MSEGVLIGIGTLIGAIFAAMVALLNALHKNSQERETTAHKQRVDRDNTAAAEQATIIDRQERQIAWLDLQLAEQQRVIALLQDEHGNCQVQLAEIYGCLVLFRELALRLAQALKELGKDPGPVPELPARPIRMPSQADPGFQARTSAHAVGVLRAVDARLAPEKGGAP